MPVYAVGSERGVHYYAMQYIEGRDLASLIAQQRGPVGANPEAAPTVDSPAGEAFAPAIDTRPLAAMSTARSTKPLEYFRTVARLGIQAA